MSKTETVRARMQPDLKDHAEAVFAKLGISPTQAITMFYKQVAMRNGLPFELVVPAPATTKTFQATDAGHDLIVCEDVEDMFAKLGI